MIIDRFNEFSSAQRVTSSAASTNVVDLQAAGGIEGTPYYLIIQVSEVVTASGSATVTFSLETDSAEGFGSAVTLWSSAAIGKAALTAGTKVIRLALNGLALNRYVRVYYTVATGPLTEVSAFDAFLTADGDTNEFYEEP